MKRFAIVAFIGMMIFGFHGHATAQRLQGTPDLGGKVVYGGTFGFGLNNRYLRLSIAPQIGYRIFNPWEIGVRGIYDMDCFFDRWNGNSYGHYFGVAPYTSIQIYRGLFLHAEDEILYGIRRWNSQTVSQKWYNTVFVGGGIRQYAENGSYVYFLALYNLSWGLLQPNSSMDTPYASPFTIRVGYCF